VVNNKVLVYTQCDKTGTVRRRASALSWDNQIRKRISRPACRPTPVRAGAEAGTVRPDVEPGDVLASMSGVSLAAGEQRDLAHRMLDLLMDGLRYSAR
jgi:hypothetical protein